MSQENTERRPKDLQKGQGPNVTEDLIKKMLQVGDQVYHLEMKQNGESRYARIIEDPVNARRTRIAIPMCVMGEMIKRFNEIVKFSSTYTASNLSEKKNKSEKTPYAHSISFTSNGGRIYYFDLIDAKDTVTLKLSYQFGRQRNTLHIIVQALPQLVEILQDFATQFPSISPTDDYPVNKARQRSKRFNDRRFPNQRQGRDYNRPFRPRGPNFNANQTPRSNENGEFRRPNGLKVVEDPAPTSITTNVKKFTVEIVEGVNTFFRITELIGENRKSTLHVPVEVCGQLQNAMYEMNRKYSQIVKAAPATNTVAPKA